MFRGRSDGTLTLPLPGWGGGWGGGVRGVGGGEEGTVGVVWGGEEGTVGVVGAAFIAPLSRV